MTAGDDLADAGFFTLRTCAGMVEPGVSELWPSDLRRTLDRWRREGSKWATESASDETATLDADMTLRTVDEIDDLLEGVSDGPWEFWPGLHGDPLVAQVGRGPFGAVAMCNTYPPADPANGWSSGADDYGRANAIFIAATRTVVPQLTGMVHKRDARIAELEAQLAGLRSQYEAPVDA